MPNTFKIAKQKGMQTYLHAVELSAAYNKEVLASLYPDKNDQPTIWSDRYLKMSESTYSNVDYVLTHTTFAKESYEKQGFKAETVKRIDFGPGNTLVDGNLVIREKPNSPFRCLFVGNFVKMKGAHILLEAFGTLNESEFELHVCGDIYPELKLQAQEAKRGNIFFHGYQNPKTFYENCDVLIFPTLSESAGRVVTEASILKLPIICTPAGTHSIILNNSSGKVIEPEPHDLKLAIIEARNNYQKFQIFAEHACELASQLSWARFGRTNLQIIKENRKDRNDKDCNS
jgi:glycosyltransferase involved in cell wall biosynthesis